MPSISLHEEMPGAELVTLIEARDAPHLREQLKSRGLGAIRLHERGDSDTLHRSLTVCAIMDADFEWLIGSGPDGYRWAAASLYAGKTPGVTDGSHQPSASPESCSGGGG